MVDSGWWLVNESHDNPLHNFMQGIVDLANRFQIVKLRLANLRPTIHHPPSTKFSSSLPALP
jgi:hypothetical protein